MASDIGSVEQRLKSFNIQLQTECGIMERLVYKHKNQHRRCSYFQYILKVRRDLNLLKSTNLEEIFEASFLIINGNRPKQKVQLLESLKRRKCERGKYNFLERLLGATRLLSQVVETMLKAATEISTLLARSFFMKFSLTILAVLARIRVLVQQMLLDAVYLYNRVSDLSRKEQTVKLNQGGFDVFREYYPIKEEASVILECVWQTDKYVLVERTHKCETHTTEKDDQNDVLIKASSILYENIEALLGVEEPGNTEVEHISVNANPGNAAEDGGDSMMNKHENYALDATDTANISSTNIVLPENLSTDINTEMVSKGNSKMSVEDGSCNMETPHHKSVPVEVVFPTVPISSPIQSFAKLKNDEGKKVAFVSVKFPSSTTSEQSSCQTKETEKSKGDKDPFFSLLTGGNQNTNLF